MVTWKSIFCKIDSISHIVVRVSMLQFNSLVGTLYIYILKGGVQFWPKHGFSWKCAPALPHSFQTAHLGCLRPHTGELDHLVARHDKTWNGPNVLVHFFKWRWTCCSTTIGSTMVYLISILKRRILQKRVRGGNSAFPLAIWWIPLFRFPLKW